MSLNRVIELTNARLKMFQAEGKCLNQFFFSYALIGHTVRILFQF